MILQRQRRVQMHELLVKLEMQTSALSSSTALKHPYAAVALDLIQELLASSTVVAIFVSFNAKAYIKPLFPLLSNAYYAAYVPRNASV